MAWVDKVRQSDGAEHDSKQTCSTGIDFRHGAQGDAHARCRDSTKGVCKLPRHIRDASHLFRSASLRNTGMASINAANPSSVANAARAMASMSAALTMPLPYAKRPRRAVLTAVEATV